MTTNQPAAASAESRPTRGLLGAIVGRIEWLPLPVGVGEPRAGSDIYAAPEYSGPPFARSPNQWNHALAHLTIGIAAPVLLGWGVGSVVLQITKRVVRRPAVA